MPPLAVATLVDILRKHHLLEPDQLAKLPGLQGRLPDSKALARELIQRGWLTPFQANQIFQGKAAELVLGSYVLLEKLGEGGMGTVYKARHQTMGRIVALKLIRKERLENANAAKRFRREIKSAAQLNHPNIVLAFDADEVRGVHFFTMEYVAGTDLSQLVKTRGPLPIDMACDCIRQAALGLQHAHERGMVHRDIKPANLLVSGLGREASAFGPAVTVKILDMGLARRASDVDGDSSSAVTREGTVVGTPDYLAPEQAIGSAETDIRADLYSLGATFFFLLTGRVLFPGAGIAEKLLRHQMQEPDPVEKLRPDVPPAVAAVVRKLLAKKPEDRFQTPAELAAHLAAFGQRPAEGTPLPEQTAELPAFDAPPLRTPPVYRPRPRKGRQQRQLLVLSAGGGVVLLILAGLLAFLFTRGKSAPVSGRTVVDARPQPPASAAFALDFPGRPAYVHVPRWNYDGSQPITLEAWVRPRPGAGNRAILDDWEQSGIGLWLVSVDNQTHAEFMACGPAGYQRVRSNDEIAADRWVHLAGVLDARELRLYVNGLMQIPPTPRDEPYRASTMPFLIGANPTPPGDPLNITTGDHFQGLIDEVRVSNVARYGLNFTPAARFAPDAATLLLYHFDEGQGQTAHDASSNGRDGQIRGAVWVEADR